jgi:tRNA(Arg) A34 adenosine deaminase TadA
VDVVGQIAGAVILLAVLLVAAVLWGVAQQLGSIAVSNARARAVAGRNSTEGKIDSARHAESTSAAPATRAEERHDPRGWNVLAVVSIAAAAIAAGAIFSTGIAVLAVFAVGAGHVALRQISASGERGRELAVVGLVTGYLTAVWGLTATVGYWMALAQQSGL